MNYSQVTFARAAYCIAITAPHIRWICEVVLRFHVYMVQWLLPGERCCSSCQNSLPPCHHKRSFFNTLFPAPWCGLGVAFNTVFEAHQVTTNAAPWVTIDKPWSTSTDVWEKVCRPALAPQFLLKLVVSERQSRLELQWLVEKKVKMHASRFDEA
jgi:hypothetical protein